MFGISSLLAGDVRTLCQILQILPLIRFQMHFRISTVVVIAGLAQLIINSP
jgi:hypothetical protein